VKITNKAGLPEALVKAITNDPYNAGDSDYTATSLLKPARVRALEARHKHEIEEDAEDGLYRLYGQVAHGILERANMADLAEKRFFIKVSGFKVSAQIDTLSLDLFGTLSDFKFTTAWGFKSNQEPKPEWVAQLNIQCEILRQNGYEPKALKIIGLLRDFSLRESASNPEYPRGPVAALDIPMWSREQTIAFIQMRIAAHEDAKRDLPECSSDERWAKPDTWAVIKRGQKRAINGGVQMTEELAQKVCEKNPGTFVQYRKGESVRCASYCSVAKFCTSYQRTLNAAPGADEESA
jgi:hypothetical protein